MENIEGEYNFQFQEFLPIPSSSMDKLSIKERIIIEVCDFLETWCWFLFATQAETLRDVNIKVQRMNL